jgi:purine-nucleoside phosphorylase
MYAEIKTTADFLGQHAPFRPDYLLVLGSGLGNATEEMEVIKKIRYSDIPGFPESTVEGHAGNLVWAYFGNKPVVVMQGRFHYYEGYSLTQTVFPLRALSLTGIKGVMLTNAAGGMSPDFEIGDIMFISDHINLFPDNPLRGRNIDELGPRFPDMSEPYSKQWLTLACEVAGKLGVDVREGIYAGVQGPTYETPAEYRAFYTMGAHAVGMSTIPEVIAARHIGLPCFAASIITDLGAEGKVVEVSHEEVQQIAAQSAPKLIAILEGLLRAL